MNYITLTRWARFFQIIASLCLMAIVIVRFVFFVQLGSFPNYVMTFYYLIFSVYLLLFEFGVKTVKSKFYLLNFCWGKGLFNVFLGSMIIAAYVIPFIDIPCCIILFMSAFILFLISCKFRKEEKQRIDKELEDILKMREEDDKRRMQRLENEIAKRQKELQKN